MSDIILQPIEEDQKLYANKTILAMHSSHFQAIFFSGKFTDDTVVFDVPYDVMLEILKIIHHTERKCELLPRKQDPFSSWIIRTFIVFASNLG